VAFGRSTSAPLFPRGTNFIDVKEDRERDVRDDVTDRAADVYGACAHDLDEHDEDRC
jgi:hypothetical protein